MVHPHLFFFFSEINSQFTFFFLLKRLKVSLSGFYAPFRGNVVILASDFRQIFVVIPKRTRQHIVRASFDVSYVWLFCRALTLTKNMRLQSECSKSNVEGMYNFSVWLLSIDDGRIGEIDDRGAEIEIPDDLLITKSGDLLASISNNTFPSLLKSMTDQSFFQ